MAPIPTISLEQWRALVAVVDDGGYAAAAEAIHKSQSAVTYAVQQVEKLLGVKAFRLEGRKAVLTPVGRMLYSRSPSCRPLIRIIRCFGSVGASRSKIFASTGT